MRGECQTMNHFLTSVYISIPKLERGSGGCYYITILYACIDKFYFELTVYSDSFFPHLFAAQGSGREITFRISKNYFQVT